MSKSICINACHKLMKRESHLRYHAHYSSSLLGLMAKIKCSICSYQFNIWYAGHSPAQILIWFLAFGQGSEVYLTLTTGCLGIALQPSAAHQHSYLNKNRGVTTIQCIAVYRLDLPIDCSFVASKHLTGDHSETFLRKSCHEAVSKMVLFSNEWCPSVCDVCPVVI